MLEQSLQAVDPRVSLAYWDYTLDFWERVDRGVGGELLRVGHDLLKLWDSDVFSAKFFGASDLETGVITTGRWAHSAVPVVSEQLYVHAGFTSPWVKQGFARPRRDSFQKLTFRSSSRERLDLDLLRYIF